MPELPEVENVKLSLRALGVEGQTFAKVDLRRANLRTALKRELAKRLPGQSIQHVERRAKFLLFETQDFLLINHLGMTGSWRKATDKEELGKHDHVVMHFTSGLTLIFNDPRRFGLLELQSKAATTRANRWLKHLGVEPLSEQFNAEFLIEQSRGLKAPIKNVIMNQKRVVGVGNIYASEALYRAGVKPTRPAGRLKATEAEKLVTSIRQVLEKAITAGGSTIRDYRNSHGESGSFQQQFAVYGRAGEPCAKCGQKLKSKVLAGRNTFWCPQCQS